MQKAESQKKCPECGSTRLVRDYERAELVCASCGYVIHAKIMDMGPEWRAFDQEQRERRGRVGVVQYLRFTTINRLALNPTLRKLSSTVRG